VSDDDANRHAQILMQGRSQLLLFRSVHLAVSKLVRLSGPAARRGRDPAPAALPN
jgi:hypothetical protein